MIAVIGANGMIGTIIAACLSEGRFGSDDLCLRL